MSGGYLQYTPEKVVLFIKATAVLHNICRLANLPDPDIPDQDMEHPEEAQDVHFNGMNTRNRLILDFFKKIEATQWSRLQFIHLYFS